MVEINDLRRRIAKLKFERASVTIIDELEAQLRILKAIYDSATNLYAAGETDPRLQEGLRDQPRRRLRVPAGQRDDWPLPDPKGQDLATVIWHHDYAAPLLNAVHAK